MVTVERLSKQKYKIDLLAISNTVFINEADLRKCKYIRNISNNKQY